jgi:hypothetical protein
MNKFHPRKTSLNNSLRHSHTAHWAEPADPLFHHDSFVEFIARVSTWAVGFNPISQVVKYEPPAQGIKATANPHKRPPIAEETHISVSKTSEVLALPGG